MISLHVIADNASDYALDRAITYLKNTRQPYVQVGGGSQIDRAMQFVERAQIAVPGITVFWRVLEDTGNIFTMSPETWWNQRIAPRLKWMQEHKVIMVVDNESSGDDALIRQYVDLSLLRMARLHDHGLRGAYCRFATGNIRESQYTLLKPLLAKMRPDDWLSPNEYTNTPGKSSGGHLARFRHICDVIPTKRWNVAIGECGILNNYEAHNGYQNSISGRAAAEQILADEIWYANGSIPRFWFAVGGYQEWASMQPNEEWYTTLERHYADHPITSLPPAPETPPPVTPPPFPDKLLLLVVLNQLRASTQAQLDIINEAIKLIE